MDLKTDLLQLDGSQAAGLAEGAHRSLGGSDARNERPGLGRETELRSAHREQLAARLADRRDLALQSRQERLARLLRGGQFSGGLRGGVLGCRDLVQAADQRCRVDRARLDGLHSGQFGPRTRDRGIERRELPGACARAGTDALRAPLGLGELALRIGLHLRRGGRALVRRTRLLEARHERPVHALGDAFELRLPAPELVARQARGRDLALHARDVAPADRIEPVAGLARRARGASERAAGLLRCRDGSGGELLERTLGALDAGLKTGRVRLEQDDATFDFGGHARAPRPPALEGSHEGKVPAAHKGAAGSDCCDASFLSAALTPRKARVKTLKACPRANGR